MRFALERVTQPDIEPVTLAEIIQHVREFATLSQAGQDDLTALIVASREWVEDYTGRALIDQSWRLTLLGRPGSLAGGDTVGGYAGPGPVQGYYSGTWQWGRSGEIVLPKSPVIAITGFVSVDAAGVSTTVDPTTYELREADSKWPRLVALNGATWSSWLNGDLRITFRAGFADRVSSPQQGAEAVPTRIKWAMKLWAEGVYNRDEKMMKILLETAEAVAKPERSELQMA